MWHECHDWFYISVNICLFSNLVLSRWIPNSADCQRIVILTYSCPKHWPAKILIRGEVVIPLKSFVRCKFALRILHESPVPFHNLLSARNHLPPKLESSFLLGIYFWHDSLEVNREAGKWKRNNFNQPSYSKLHFWPLFPGLCSCYSPLFTARLIGFHPLS